MAYVNYDGKLKPAGTSFFSEKSRALRYGDGLFETILLNNGTLVLGEDHFARLWKGMQAFGFDIPRLFSPSMLEEEIMRTAAKNDIRNARVRLAVYRGEGGLYDPENMRPIFVIETLALERPAGGWNENGLTIGIHQKARKVTDAFANLKTNNFLPYVLAANEAKQQRWNDAIVLNQHGRIADSTIANLFIVKDEIIKTPALTEGCIAGVMRKFIISAGRQEGFDIQETDITIENFLQADECFLTNSIRPMRWVKQCGESNYTPGFTHKLYNRLQETNPLVFC